MANRINCLHISALLFRVQCVKMLFHSLAFNIFCCSSILILVSVLHRDHSEYGLSQWETTLHCNVVFHWLHPYPEWSLLQTRLLAYPPSLLVRKVLLCKLFSVIWMWIRYILEVPLKYRQTSDIKCTKSQNINVSRPVLQLSFPNPLKPGVKSRMKM